MQGKNLTKGNKRKRKWAGKKTFTEDNKKEGIKDQGFGT
jgi:hypothetical protein